jgi:hypothetical protein
MHRCLVTDCHEHLQSLLGLIVVAKNDDHLPLNEQRPPAWHHSTRHTNADHQPLPAPRADRRVFGVIGNAESANREDIYGAFVTPFDKPRGDKAVHTSTALGEGALWVCDEDGPGVGRCRGI